MHEFKVQDMTCGHCAGTIEKAVKSADPAAKPATTLSWDGVELVGGLLPGKARQQVRTADGKTWFVAADRLRSAIDYRLTASSRDGKWSFTSLIAGD